MKLTIKETVDNMIDELGRANDVLKGLGCADENMTEIMDDIDRTLLDEVAFLKERIDLALLMSAVVGDISIPTCEEIYEVEANYDLPLENNVIDAEAVYNTIEDSVKVILNED